MIVFSVMNLGLQVNFNAKQITSHFYYFGQVTLVVFVTLRK